MGNAATSLYFSEMVDAIPITLVKHDPAWAEQARQEGLRLRGVLGDNLIVVHHIGSTAIPDIEAKPIIDLIPEVRDLAALDACEAQVRALGYDWRGEFGLPGRRFCVLSDAQGRRLVHVHAYQSGSSEIARHLAFRDYLRAHPDQARDYVAVKMAARERHPWDQLAYNDAKDGWIKACERRALAWASAG